ncbi:MAG TPA: hypothetical protein VJ608_11495, partial [Albitalea sp.]|nr:hypothetical protein [Albitalea sp.]
GRWQVRVTRLGNRHASVHEIHVGCRARRGHSPKKLQVRSKLLDLERSPHPWRRRLERSEATLQPPPGQSWSGYDGMCDDDVPF